MSTVVQYGAWGVSGGVVTVTEARDVINYNTCVLVSTQVAQPTVQSTEYRVNNTRNNHVCINQVSNRTEVLLHTWLWFTGWWLSLANKCSMIVIVTRILFIIIQYGGGIFMVPSCSPSI